MFGIVCQALHLNKCKVCRVLSFAFASFSSLSRLRPLHWQNAFALVAQRREKCEIVCICPALLVYINITFFINEVHLSLDPILTGGCATVHKVNTFFERHITEKKCEKLGICLFLHKFYGHVNIFIKYM